MNKTIEKFIIERSEAPFKIEFGLYIPDDGLNLVDVQYLAFDDRRLEPVGNDVATNILEMATNMIDLMADMIPHMRRVKRIEAQPEPSLRLNIYDRIADWETDLTPAEINTLTDQVLQLFVTLCTEVIKALPTKWDTEARHTEQTNRQLGYNEALIDSKTALDAKLAQLTTKNTDA